MGDATGLISVNINEMVRIVSKTYISFIKKKMSFKKVPSIMLWGPPGVGKSQGVRQIANEIEWETGKRVVITDVRLLLFNPVDLRGIPTANTERTLAVWLKPKIFQMDEGEDVVNILFLDEISAAPQSVQAAAYQITLDRTVGEHKLPDNCIVIAAGNRITDKSVVYNMPKALANRLCHFDIKEETTAWHDWAIKNGIHKYITGYLEYNVSGLMKFDASGVGLAFPTPRSWEMLSNILNTVSENIDEIYPLIVGCIGSETAHYFRIWCDLYKNVPNIENIFNGRAYELPKLPEQLVVLRTEMVEYARNHPVKESIDNSIAFSCELPWSFRGKLLHDYYQIPTVRPILKENEVFQMAVRDGLR